MIISMVADLHMILLPGLGCGLQRWGRAVHTHLCAGALAPCSWPGSGSTLKCFDFSKVASFLTTSGSLRPLGPWVTQWCAILIYTTNLGRLSQEALPWRAREEPGAEPCPPCCRSSCSCPAPPCPTSRTLSLFAKRLLENVHIV